METLYTSRQTSTKACSNKQLSPVCLTVQQSDVRLDTVEMSQTMENEHEKPSMLHGRIMQVCNVR